MCEAEYRLQHEVWDWLHEGLGEEDSEAVFSTAQRIGLTQKQERLWWWRELAAPPTPEQLAALWAAVLKPKIYEVIETKLLD